MDPSEGKVDDLALRLRKRMVISLKEASWEEAGQSMEYAVLLRRASGRTFKKKIVTEILNRIWKVEEQPTFQKVENNTLLANFKTEKDRNKVLEGGPWMFEGEALVFQKWEEGMTAEDFNNTKINIFVQIFGLPFELRKDSSAREVVERFGKIKEHKSNGSLKESAYGKEYMRYRIEVDINTPILNGFYLERRGRKPTWINLKYERLPNICFNCGVLSHETKTCKVVHVRKRIDFGVWLRAEERTEYNPEWTEYEEPPDSGTEQWIQDPMEADLTLQGAECDREMMDPINQGEGSLTVMKELIKEMYPGEGAGNQEEDISESYVEEQGCGVGPGPLVKAGEGKEKDQVYGPGATSDAKGIFRQRKRGVEEWSGEEGGTEKKQRREEEDDLGVAKLAGNYESFNNEEAESAVHLRRER